MTTADFDKFTKDIVDNSIKIKNLVEKCAFTGLTFWFR